MRRGQASSEYVIILAVVLILALVAVAVLGGFIDVGGEMDDDTSKAYWRTSGSTPEVGILNWELDSNGTFLAEIRNNADYAIRLEQFLVDGSDVLGGALTLPIGARQVICGETSGGIGTYTLPARAVYKSLPHELAKDFTGREPVVGRYVTEQVECPPATAGCTPVFWLTFDECGGDTTGDASGFGNDATNNNATWVTAGCVSGCCISFDGSTSYLNASDHPSLDIEGNITITTWLNVANLAEAGIIVNKGEVWGLYYRPDGSVAFPMDGPGYGNIFTPAGVLNEDEWAFIVATYNGSEARIYKNDALAHTEPASGGIPVDDYFLAVGADSPSPHQDNALYGYPLVMEGKLDELKVWNCSLSEAEVLAEYNSY